MIDGEVANLFAGFSDFTRKIELSRGNTSGDNGAIGDSLVILVWRKRK